MICGIYNPITGRMELLKVGEFVEGMIDPLIKHSASVYVKIRFEGNETEKSTINKDVCHDYHLPLMEADSEALKRQIGDLPLIRVDCDGKKEPNKNIYGLTLEVISPKTVQQMKEQAQCEQSKK
jgi:hypothetical protein